MACGVSGAGHETHQLRAAGCKRGNIFDGRRGRIHHPNAGSGSAKAIIPGCRPVPFGHLGDGNVHFNVSQPIGADTAQFLARWGEVNDAVNKIVLKYNGSISAEHGIGKLKRNSLPKVKDPVALELMRGLKRMLDPNGILNPGKVL